MDDYSRLWFDDVDDTDAEAFNDLEARHEARTAAVAAGGIELGYASTTTEFTTTSTAAGGVIIPGVSVTVAVATRPIVVYVRADLWNSTAGFGGALLLNTDGASAGVIASCLGDNWTTLVGRRRLQPAAGSHTFAIYGKNASAGTLDIKAGPGTGTGNSPISIQVIEV